MKLICKIWSTEFNRYSRVSILFIILFLLGILGSCCPDDISYWSPDKAVRYYDDYDSITFYCPENDSIYLFQVCHKYDTYLTELEDDRCGTITKVYFVDYFLYSDSCQSENLLRVKIYPEKNNNNNVTLNLSIFDYSNLISASYTGSPKSTVEILGYTYENTIQIVNASSWGELEYVIFSYEYGIIQLKYENQTFSLKNDEI